MTKLIFSFDTEDYVNPIGADGIADVAGMLEEYGYKGCFQVVALLAQALQKWGRQDIIDRLKAHHEVDYHSYAHSMHPTINEYTDLCDFDAALKEFFRREKKGYAIVEEIFGQNGFAAVTPPGSSTSYVAHYGYADMGIPIYTVTPPTDRKKNRPVGACNINCIAYNRCLDKYLMKATEDDLRRALDEAAQKDIYVFYHHPQMHMVDRFCDELNFNGRNIPQKDWILSNPLPHEDRERFCANFRRLLSMIKDDPRFEVTTFGEIAATLPTERKVSKEQLPQIVAALQESWFPLTIPESLSLSDCLLACKDFLLGKNEHVCEKVYGFLGEPYAITEPITLTAEEIRQSAVALDTSRVLPELIFVGDNKIGPADWLRAALAVLTGAKHVTLTPAPWQIDLGQFPALKELTYKNVWIHIKELEDRWLSDRFRLQSWTLRLPKGGDRTVL